MIFFIDTEFDGLNKRTPLSIAIVERSGNQFYAEFTGVKCTDSFVIENVEPNLWHGKVPENYTGTYIYGDAETIVNGLKKWFNSVVTELYNSNNIDKFQYVRYLNLEFWGNYPIYDIELLKNLMLSQLVWFVDDIESYDLFSVIFDISSIEKYLCFNGQYIRNVDANKFDVTKYGRNHALADAWHTCNKHYLLSYDVATLFDSDLTLEQVKVLVERGANVNAINEYGYTVLMYVKSHSGDDEIINYLIANGAIDNDTY